MRQVSATARIPAAPPDVFEFLADLQNLPRWQTGIVSAELTSPGPVGPGSRAHIVRELLGQRLAVDLALTGYEAERRLELESEASGVGVRATLDMAPDGDGTRLTFSMRISAQNLFMKPVEGMVAGAAERDVADSLERLRSHFAALEGGG